MSKKFWRAALLAALIAMSVMMLGGCFFLPGLLDSSFDSSSNSIGADNRQSVSEGYFKLTIHTDKDQFAQGEAINCWAELEYIGDQDSITVYVNGDPIEMDMNGKDVSYNSSEIISIGAQKTLTLQKGVPIRRTLTESLPKSSSVLPGQYEIDASASLSLSPDGAVSYYGSVSAVIIVE